MKTLILFLLFILGSCGLPDRKKEGPKYMVKVKTQFDSAIYFCDYYHEEENKLILYSHKSSILSEDQKMFLTIKSDQLQYEIKLNE